MDVVIILPDIKLAKFVKIAIIISIYLMVGDNGLASDEQVPEAAKWVIMIYMAADNNLEDASIFNMNQLERVGSSENTKIIVQWDRSPEYDSSNGNWTGTKRFLISKDDDEEAIGSQELEDLGEVDMGDMNSLSEFINWTLQNYPADRYALSLWNHGAGWMMHTCDDTSNTCLTLRDLSDALRRAGFVQGKKLDLLIFDECLMGLIDVANEMGPYAKVMIASEDVVPGKGIDFSLPLSELDEDPTMDERELAKVIVKSYKEFYAKEKPKPYATLAAYDLEKMPEVINATAHLSVMLGERMDRIWPQIGTSLSISESFSKSDGLAQFKLNSNYYDLFDFADLLVRKSMDKDVDDAVNDLKTAIRATIVAEYHGRAHPFAYGMTVYFPEDEEIYVYYGDQYSGSSKFASEVGWEEFLHSYIEAEQSDTIAPTIEITSISPQPSNLSHPARILGNATGNNIAYMSRIIGRVEGDRLIMLNEHQVSRYYPEYSGSRKLPEFLDGRNNIDYTWAPVIDVLTNGETSVIAPAYPLGAEDYYFTIDGKYRRSNETEPFSSRLIFDYMTGRLISAWRIDDMLINEFEPKVGDVFRPESIDIDGEMDVMEAIEMEGLTFGDCGIWLEPRPLEEGRYLVGLYVKDLSGNWNLTLRSVDIAGQPALNPPTSLRSILGRWAGYGPYGDTQFVFEFSESKLPMMDIFPLCSIWRWGTFSVKAPGKEDKVAQFIYRVRNDDGRTLLTMILLPEDQDAIYMAFLISLEGDQLEMQDIFESGLYSLKRGHKNGLLDERRSAFGTDFSQSTRSPENLTNQTTSSTVSFSIYSDYISRFLS